MNNSNLSEWHLLSEHLISGEPVRDSQSIEQMIEEMKLIDLEPFQLERIYEAITAAIQTSVKNAGQNLNNLGILIRLWVKDIEVSVSSGRGLEDQPGHRRGSNGPGFFIFEKTNDELENPRKEYSRTVNFLIYGK